MSTCLKHSTVVGCWNKADNTKENVVIHYTYATNASGMEIIKATRYTTSDGTPITLSAGDTVTPGVCSIVTQRIHQNFVVTGVAPLVIPSGAISISVTKTNNTGVVNISGDNGTAFPLTFNRENFADSVNEGYSTLSAYTITGTLAGTTYKVHIIR
jgi:hypothetical protein